MAAKLVAEEQTKERLCQELNLLVQNSAHAQVDALDALTHRLQSLSAPNTHPGAHTGPHLYCWSAPTESFRIKPQRFIWIHAQEPPNITQLADETANTGRIRKSCMREIRQSPAGESQRKRYSIWLRLWDMHSMFRCEWCLVPRMRSRRRKLHALGLVHRWRHRIGFGTCSGGCSRTGLLLLHVMDWVPGGTLPRRPCHSSLGKPWLSVCRARHQNCSSTSWRSPELRLPAQMQQNLRWQQRARRQLRLQHPKRNRLQSLISSQRSRR